MKNTRLLLISLLIVVLLVVLFTSKSTVRRPIPAFKAETQSSMSLSRTDANGVAWALDQSGGTLSSTEPNGPKAGPPILVKADVQKVGAREMSIGLVLEGQAGEQYRPAVKKNGTPLSAPKLRIVNETGQVIAQDSFQYG